MSFNSSYCQTDEPEYSPVNYMGHSTMESRAEERGSEASSVDSVNSSYQESGTFRNPILVSGRHYSRFHNISWCIESVINS